MFDAQLPLTFDDAAVPSRRPIIAVEAKARRDAIKSAGGAEYEALLVLEKETRAGWRAANRDKIRAYERKYKQPFKSMLCSNARARGRKRGLGGDNHGCRS